MIGNMETIFYKILYKGEKVVYVGITTRTIDKRFKEHLKFKGLNPDNYIIVEFGRSQHPEINSLETFYKERKKVAELERKYIKKELNRGSKLLNISEGGEWGNQVLSKLKKEEFLREFGSYEGYKGYKKKKDKTKVWIHHWIHDRSKNKTKAWIKNWIHHKSDNKTKVWIKNWIHHKSDNKTKVWLRNWIQNKSDNKTKVWINK